MVKMAELISNLEISGAKAANSKLGKKLAKEVDFANRPVKPTTLTKAELKAIDKRFEENNRTARERELAFQRKRQNEANEKRKQREAERKARLEGQSKAK